jgi:alcohol dehydrogenase
MLREWYEKDFCFQYPHLSLLGCETLVEFGFVLEKWNIHHPLIITDQTLIKTGVVDQVTSQLKKHKIKFQIYDGVQPNPSTNVVNGVVKACHKHECDALISVGGGSAHDAAKGASLILSNNHPLKKFQGLNVSKNAAKLPIIAVNTTAGTGAGATNAAVITDEQSHFKMTLTDKNIQPHILVDDSDLMIGLPVRSSM